MQTVKSRIVFRNQSNRIWYLQRRPNQPTSENSFMLGPNETVEALDGAEEMLLASMGLVDVEKETPAIANNIKTLQDELAAERAKNAILVTQNEALKDVSEKKIATRKR